MSSKVLVTGGAGFIGSHLSEMLLERGYDVVVLDDLSQGNRDWVPAKATFIQGDVADLATCRKAMQGVEGVFHLAAMSRVLPSLAGGVEMALFTTDKNIVGTANIMAAASEAGCRKLVYSASSTFYGNQDAPHIEDMKPDCLTLYAVTKYVGELYCQTFEKHYNLPCVALRYFQVYGPRQPVKGEYAMVTGIFLDQMKRGEKLTIHGDGSQSRDFVHVRDIAMANILAFEKPVSGEVINIGRGEPYTIQQLADMISPDQIHQPSRQHDLKATKADISKCARLLGWTPQISFEQGMDELLKEARQ